jgi:hypothetical protein
VKIDFGAVMVRMRRIRSQIAHHDSAARFTNLGVDVFLWLTRSKKVSIRTSIQEIKEIDVYGLRYDLVLSLDI